MRHSVYTITGNFTSFHLWWKKKFGKTSRSFKILWKWLSAKFYFAFLSLSTALIVKNNRKLPGVYFFFLKICPRASLKVFQYHIFTSIKILKKPLASKANFCNFLLFSCLNFKLKLCGKPYSYKNCEENHV